MLSRYLFSTVHLGSWNFEMCLYYGNYLILWISSLIVQAVENGRGYYITLHTSKLPNV